MSHYDMSYDTGQLTNSMIDLCFLNERS